MFRILQNNIIGNILISFAEKIPYLSLTKALKLLYLLDEHSVKEIGVPVTWLEYKVWELGPVAEDIYNEIKYSEKISIYGKVTSLDEFITIKKGANNAKKTEETYILAKKTFDESEFTEYELELINSIIEKYGKLNAKELVDLLHKENTLWSKIVKENNLTEHFKKFNSKSNYTIPFSNLIDNELKEMAYNAAFESLDFEKELTAN